VLIGLIGGFILGALHKVSDGLGVSVNLGQG
jgi:hypothetical protein